ncbi:MAG: hypothetical protein KTU85_01155 [Acidimicrobiia bacterium]|nr:hypothetical protein [Acidimicrobiia bacterium]MCY4457166.1 hypothetical protein [Acidimicrobiaceae bacterium]
MDTEELIGPDLILLLLAAPSRWSKAVDRINGITRLEKLLFLIGKECEHNTAIREPFGFIAYHYGPYSREVYEAVELLEEAELVREDRAFTDSDLDRAEELLYSDMTTEISYERQFLLTEKGKIIAEYLAKSHPLVQEEIKRIKDQYAGLTLQNLIFHVYSQYPDYSEQSIIRNKIMQS